SAGVPAITTGSLASGDTAAFTQSFNNKNVGTGKTLTPAGSVSDGNSGANYSVTLTSVNTGVITPRTLAVMAVTDSKAYDGTTNSGGVPTITSGSLAGGDTADFTQSFNNKNVGSGKTLTPSGTVSDGNGGANYTLTVTSVNTGTITGQAITTGTLATGDSASLTQAFSDKNVGTGKALTPAGSISDGNGGANYNTTFGSANTGTISARSLAITATGVNKVYVGTTSATV